MDAFAIDFNMFGVLSNKKILIDISNQCEFLLMKQFLINYLSNLERFYPKRYE